MTRRDPARRRRLGLWTASWLFLFLVVGLVRFGDPSVQWPVLLVPAVWAALAARHRAPQESRWSPAGRR